MVSTLDVGRNLFINKWFKYQVIRIIFFVDKLQCIPEWAPVVILLLDCCVLNSLSWERERKGWAYIWPAGMTLRPYWCEHHLGCELSQKEHQGPRWGAVPHSSVPSEDVFGFHWRTSCWPTLVNVSREGGWQVGMGFVYFNPTVIIWDSETQLRLFLCT